MKIKAYAKLNLFLDILGKRGDGYHELSTTMCLIDLADDVEVEVSGGEGIHGVDSDNTAYKAAELFLEHLKVQKCVNINIVKKIPMMAGLGGSSADAAAVLRSLNALLGQPLSFDELVEFGAKVGSDVPFCIHGGHALCRGRGTEIAEVLPLPDCVFVIVKPDFECSSREAYTLYTKNPIQPVQFKQFYNVFERLYENPEIDKIKAELMAYGAQGACLTGSGSAVFGAFGDEEKAQRAFKNLNYKEKFIAKPVKVLEKSFNI